MKYAHQVIDLMAAFPGRDWRMVELVRYVEPTATVKKRHSVRISVMRVLISLEDAGVLIKRPSTARGKFATYRWKSAT